MVSRFTRLLVGSATLVAVSGCLVDGIETGTTVDHKAALSSQAFNPAYEKGKEMLAAGHLGLALEKFKSALADEPRSVRVVNALAVTYDRLGRGELAELYYDRALAIDPDYSVTLNNVGYSMVRRERYEEALIYFEQALKSEPMGMARQLIVANRQEAIDRLRVARQKKPAAKVVKAALSGPSKPDEMKCPTSDRHALDRTGERVFTLVTRPGRDAVVLPDHAIECLGPRRSRVAMVTTARAPAGKTLGSPRVHQLATTDFSETPDMSAAGTKPFATTTAKSAVAKSVEPKPAAPKLVASKSGAKAAIAKPAVSGNLKVEISNGAGRNKLAARVRSYLEKKGLPVSFLTNAASFDNERTTIFYKSGERAEAEKFAAHLPVPVEFVQTDVNYADIRIRLGRDILAFDTSVLYATVKGDSSA